MGDLEKFAKETGRQRLRQLLLTRRDVYPCAYGGGDCVVSCLKDSLMDEDLHITHQGYCMKARQIRARFFGTKRTRAKELKRAGCPYHEYGFLGWKCKFADGGLHEL